MAFDGGTFTLLASSTARRSIGLVVTFLLVAITEYYTGTRWRPVKSIAAGLADRATRRTSSQGLAVGMQATALPVIVIAAGDPRRATTSPGLYGIGVAVMAQLSMTGLIVALDAYGPVTDNAGGIAEMADLPTSPCARSPTRSTRSATRRRPSRRATRSARPGSPRWSCSTSTRAGLADAGARRRSFALDDPWVIAGLFIGGLMPFLFASLAMKAVGRVGGEVVEEVRRQFREIPGIMEGTARPDYARAVDIVTGVGDQER